MQNEVSWSVKNIYCQKNWQKWQEVHFGPWTRVFPVWDSDGLFFLAVRQEGPASHHTKTHRIHSMRQSHTVLMQKHPHKATECMKRKAKALTELKESSLQGENEACLRWAPVSGSYPAQLSLGCCFRCSCPGSEKPGAATCLF